MKTQIVTTDRLTMIVEDRKNLTSQVREVVDQISAEIEELCLAGYEIKIEDVGTFELVNIDSSVYLAVHGGKDQYGFLTRYLFNHPEAFGASVTHTEDYAFYVATRSKYLLFANNIEKIIKAYEEHENTLLDAMKSALDHMQVIAEQ